MTQWMDDLMRPLEVPALLTREGFIAKYFPQYAKSYEPPKGIRLAKPKKDEKIGKPITSTKGSIQAQQTRRNHRIDAAYSDYISSRNAVIQMNERSVSRAEYEDHTQSATN